MVKKKIVRSVCAFSFACACGTFVGLAGGVEWGTYMCGLTAVLTLLVAGVLAAVASIEF